MSMQPPAISAALDRHNPLVRYDEMCRATDATYEVEEVKDFHYKAEAMRVYAQKAKVLS